MKAYSLDCDLSKLTVGKKMLKTDSARVYEGKIFMQEDDTTQSLLFWSPLLNCKMKDENHIVFDLPCNDDGENFFTFLSNMDQSITTLAQENWVKWFGKDYPGDEDIAERYRTNIKVGSKDDCLRTFHTKVSPFLKCKMNNEELQDIELPFNENKSTCNARGLIELKRIVVGRANFKAEFVVHQLLLSEEVETEVEPNQYTSETDWINL